jgi:hypothetical protein
MRVVFAKVPSPSIAFTRVFVYGNALTKVPLQRCLWVLSEPFLLQSNAFKDVNGYNIFNCYKNTN